LVGRLGRDPTVETLGNGKVFCTFSLATSERWVDSTGEKREQVEWHRVICWGQLAEVCAEYLSKGSLVCVQGHISSRECADRDGAKRRATEIIASRVEFLTPRQPREEAKAEKAALRVQRQVRRGGHFF